MPLAVIILFPLVIVCTLQAIMSRALMWMLSVCTFVLSNVYTHINIYATLLLVRNFEFNKYKFSGASSDCLAGKVAYFVICEIPSKHDCRIRPNFPEYFGSLIQFPDAYFLAQAFNLEQMNFSPFTCWATSSPSAL